MRNFLLYAAPFLNLISVLPYIIDVIRGKTKPNVVSWVTWTVLTGIGTAAVIAEEGFLSSLLPLSSTFCTLAVVLLGLKFGFAKYSKLDIVCQVSALFGLGLWVAFNSPLIALFAVIVIDFIAAVPTLAHSYRSPKEETWQTFALASFAALLTIFAFENLTAANAAYPFYLLIANGTIAGVIVYSRVRKGLALSR